MEQNVLEKLKDESDSLYKAVLKAAKKKWDITDFTKLSPELYTVTLANVKKPEKAVYFKCYYIQGFWTVWAYEDEEKLKASVSALKKS
jgi:hypothetical protein